MSLREFQNRLVQQLHALDAAGQRRTRRVVEAISSTECRVDGKHCVSFATNDYLGLSRHPTVLAAQQNVAREQAGATSSALIAGRSEWHAQLEADLATFEGTESVVLFPSGYAANFGTLTALIRESDIVFCDRDNHASLIDGCRASAGKFQVYDRGDLSRLRSALKRRRNDFDQAYIVTDSVFSMDGEVAELPLLCNIAEELNALLIVDEAHATGVFGAHGRGVGEVQGVESRVAVRIGTLSKALGGLGGFVAGSQVLCDVLWNTARSQFFSTSLPPSICAAASTALSIVAAEPERRERLQSNARLARALLAEHRLPAIAVCDDGSPIVAVPLGSESQAVELSTALLSRGIFIPAIRPPTVPRGTSRLRLSLNAEHSTSQIASAAECIAELMDVRK